MFKLTNMRLHRKNLVVFALMLIAASLYRFMPDRPLGFAPQIALALFGGAVVADKKWAFFLPILSMFISDLMFQWAFLKGYSAIPGFYAGQLVNYILFAALTVFGFLLRNKRLSTVVGGLIGGPVLFFLSSNFLVWIAGGGYARPKNFSGLIACYIDGLPFLYGSLAATVLFGGLLFGFYYLGLTKKGAESVA